MGLCCDVAEMVLGSGFPEYVDVIRLANMTVQPILHMGCVYMYMLLYHRNVVIYLFKAVMRIISEFNVFSVLENSINCTKINLTSGQPVEKRLAV